jgi:exopolysaccharide production protein ExoZ
MYKIQSLQILRAFAAIQVLITHVFQQLNYKPFGNRFLSGQYGVDIFFILSGFLIFLTTKDNAQPLVYLKKRIFRIYPLYIFMVLAYIFVYYNTGIRPLNMNGLQFVQNLLMFPWNSSLGYDSLIVGVAWSTVFEMFFYILFFIFLLFKIQKKWILIIIPILMIVGMGVHLLRLIQVNTPFLSYILSLCESTNLLFFTSGCFLSYLFQNDKLPRFKNKNTYIYIFILILVISIVMILLKHNFVISLLVMSCLFFMIISFERIFTLKMNNYFIKKIIYIGDISFSIYLIHILVILVLKNSFGINNLIGLLLVTLIITVLLSSITYKYIEQPFIAYAKKK